MEPVTHKSSREEQQNMLVHLREIGLDGEPLIIDVANILKNLWIGRLYSDNYINEISCFLRLKKSDVLEECANLVDYNHQLIKRHRNAGKLASQGRQVPKTFKRKTA